MKRLKMSLKVATLTAALNLISVVHAAPLPWPLAALTPKDLTVGKVNELEWALKLPNSMQLLPKDCIEFVVTSPYKDPLEYSSFKKDSPTRCKFYEGPKQAKCSIPSP